MWQSSCPSIFCWRDYSFPIEYYWHPCQNQLTVGVWAYFWTHNSIPLIHMCVLMTATHCFDQYIFVLSFKVVNYYSSNFVLYFQDCFHYAGSLGLPHEFLQWGLSFKQLLFFIHIHLFIQQILFVCLLCARHCVRCLKTPQWAKLAMNLAFRELTI